MFPETDSQMSRFYSSSTADVQNPTRMERKYGTVLKHFHSMNHLERSLNEPASLPKIPSLHCFHSAADWKDSTDYSMINTVILRSLSKTYVLRNLICVQ